MCFDLSDISEDNTSTQLTTPTASEALLGAVALIEEHGYSRKLGGRGRGGEFSALGAIRQVVLGRPEGFLAGSNFAEEAQRIQKWFFAKKGDSLGYWASRPAASKVRVLGAMRKAAEELASEAHRS